MRRNGSGAIGWIVGLIILYMFLNLLSSGMGWALIWIGTGLLLLMALLRFIGSQSQDRTSTSARTAPNSWINAVAAPELTPEQIALKAMSHVGRSPKQNGVQLKDIGVLAYDGGSQPKIHRVETVEAQATHLRPFIVIDLAILKGAQGRIQFQLIDESGNIRFTSSERYKLQPGENFITTPNWQPMGHSEPGGNWNLRVNIGETPIAEHRFKITPDSGSEFRPYLRSDGEIEEWLSKAAKVTSTQEISLDDLLADQEEISVEMLSSGKR